MQCVATVAAGIVLTAAPRAEARDTVGGLGGLYFGVDSDGNLLYQVLGPDDTVPANTTAYATTATTESPCDPRDGGTVTVYCDNPGCGTLDAAPGTILNIIPGSVVIVYYDDNSFSITWAFKDACGNTHYATIYYHSSNGNWRGTVDDKDISLKPSTRPHGC
jgi:hypothetical protein